MKVTVTILDERLNVKVITSKIEVPVYHKVTNGGTEQIQSDFDQTDETAVDFIKNKPTLDDTVTDESENAVKSSGIWAAIQALWQSVLDAFALLTSDGVGNESDVTGVTVTDALNNLQAFNRSYEATSFDVIQGGTVTGDIAGVQHDNDGSVLRVDEATGGLTVDFTFTNVESFNFISMHLRYVGGANHVWDIQLYNYTTADWDTIGETIGTQGELTWFNVSVPQFQNYLNAGEVKVRFYHLPNFISSHYVLFDYVAVVASITAASPTASSIIVSDPVTPDFTPAVQGNNLQQVTNKVAGLQECGFSFEIVQTTGTDINKIMSQKAVTDELRTLKKFGISEYNYDKIHFNSVAGSNLFPCFSVLLDTKLENNGFTSQELGYKTSQYIDLTNNISRYYWVEKASLVCFYDSSKIFIPNAYYSISSSRRIDLNGKESQIAYARVGVKSTDDIELTQLIVTDASAILPAYSPFISENIVIKKEYIESLIDIISRTEQLESITSNAEFTDNVTIKSENGNVMLTPEFWEKTPSGTNLFDKNWVYYENKILDVTAGSPTLGEIIDGSGYTYDYMKLADDGGGLPYWVNNQCSSICFYDSSKTFIPGAYYIVKSDRKITPASNAVFFRISLESNDNKDTLYLIQSDASTAPEYSEYTYSDIKLKYSSVSGLVSIINQTQNSINQTQNSINQIQNSLDPLSITQISKEDGYLQTSTNLNKLMDEILLGKRDFENKKFNITKKIGGLTTRLFPDINTARIFQKHGTKATFVIHNPASLSEESINNIKEIQRIGHDVGFWMHRSASCIQLKDSSNLGVYQAMDMESDVAGLVDDYGSPKEGIEEIFVKDGITYIGLQQQMKYVTEMDIEMIPVDGTDKIILSNVPVSTNVWNFYVWMPDDEIIPEAIRNKWVWVGVPSTQTPASSRQFPILIFEALSLSYYSSGAIFDNPSSLSITTKVGLDMTGVGGVYTSIDRRPEYTNYPNERARLYKYLEAISVFKQLGLERPFSVGEPRTCYEDYCLSANPLKKLGFLSGGVDPLHQGHTYNMPDELRYRYSTLGTGNINDPLDSLGSSNSINIDPANNPDSFTTEEAFIRITSAAFRNKVLTERQRTAYTAVEYQKWDELLELCNKYNIPVLSMREWNYKLFDCATNPSENIMPKCSIDYNGDGIPDGYNPIPSGCTWETNELSGSRASNFTHFIRSTNGVFFYVKYLGGSEKGFNNIAIYTKGKADDVIRFDIKQYIYLHIEGDRFGTQSNTETTTVDLTISENDSWILIKLESAFDIHPDCFFIDVTCSLVKGATPGDVYVGQTIINQQ